MIPDNDAMKYFEFLKLAFLNTEFKDAWKEEVKVIESALQKSAQVDNDTRIKVLKEMGFNHEFTLNEDGSLRQHIITREDQRGFFINHTSLVCAMQRIPIGLRVLAKADMKAQADGLVKALEWYKSRAELDGYINTKAHVALQQFNEPKGA